MTLFIYHYGAARAGVLPLRKKIRHSPGFRGSASEKRTPLAALTPGESASL